MSTVKLLIDEFVYNSNLSFLSICGETGSGKTLAIKEYISESNSNDADYSFVYSHAPIVGGSKEVFQSILSAASGYRNTLPKRTEYEIINQLESILKYKNDDGIIPVIVIDDAQNLLLRNILQVTNSLKQVTEKMIVKFIFLSTEEILPTLPSNVALRCKEHSLQRAIAHDEQDELISKLNDSNNVKSKQFVKAKHRWKNQLDDLERENHLLR